MNNVIRRYIRRYIEEKKKAPLRSAFLASPVFLPPSFLLIFLRSSSHTHFLTSPILFHPIPFSSVLPISISISIFIYLIHHFDTLNINSEYQYTLFCFSDAWSTNPAQAGRLHSLRAYRVVSLRRGRAARSCPKTAGGSRKWREFRQILESV